MARTLHQLTIFASGPSTVEAEKAALRVAAEEVNRRCEKTHAVTLRVVGWPEDIRPGANTDPQAELENQIGADFDIYVGIIGSRFGTPTMRWGSGTEEEFEEALSRFQRDSTTVRLLFYFKRTAEDPLLIDPSQLRKVLEFRQSLATRGVLYRDFKDTAEFSRLVREHLDALIIDEWQRNRWRQVAAVPLPVKSDEPKTSAIASMQGQEILGAPIDEHEDDEPGVLECMSAFHDASEQIGSVMSAISNATEQVGLEIRARSVEAESITAEFEKYKGDGSSRVQQQLRAKVCATVDRAAANLDEYSSAMSPNVEEFRVLIRALFGNMRGFFQAGAELGPRDTTDDRRALANLVQIIEASREHVMGFQTNISRVPALTGRFKRSRKRAAAVLGKMIAEMSFAIQEATSVLAEIGGAPDPETVVSGKSC